MSVLATVAYLCSRPLSGLTARSRSLNFELRITYVNWSRTFSLDAGEVGVRL